MNKKQLLPCGCGGEAITDYIIGEPGEGLGWFVYCKNCEMQLPAEYSTEDEAIYAWNLAMRCNKYEHHIDHTDCIWYWDGKNRCPSTCSQYRDGWNDAMNYIFKNGKGYNPYRRGEHE